MFKIVLNIILIFFLVGIEISGFSARFFLNPYVCFVIFFALLANNKYLLLPILGGVILDFFSLFNFPLFTLSFLVTFLFIKFFAERVITFKNFFSITIFSVGGILIYNLTFFILNSIIYLLNFDNNFIVFNSKYFLHLIVNMFFTFILLVIFKKKYDRSVLFVGRK